MKTRFGVDTALNFGLGLSVWHDSDRNGSGQRIFKLRNEQLIPI